MSVQRPRAAVLVATTLLAGCSVSVSLGDTPKGTAEDVIENQLASQLGLGTVTATCDEPSSPDVGVTFTCTSPLTSGDTVRWLATLTDEDTVNVQSLNLLTSDDLTTIEAEAVRVLEEQVGGTLGTENFDCGEGPIVLGADATVLCALTDPANGDVYDTTLTITDIDQGVFDIVVADAPR